MPDVKAAKGCKRACTLSHWQKASPQALFIVVTGGYARIIKKESGVQMSTLTNKLLYVHSTVGASHMSDFTKRGADIRVLAKSLVLEFMKSDPDCGVGSDGLKQSVIFRKCGLDWGDYPVATSSNQQYWLVAILQELAKEKLIERVSESGPWRIKS